jgi:DNA-binding transcriptional LysR family regulator
MRPAASPVRRACYTSQPTVSRELARLEQLLGYALFERAQGRLRPRRGPGAVGRGAAQLAGLERVIDRALELGQAQGPMCVLCLPALSHAAARRAGTLAGPQGAVP